MAKTSVREAAVAGSFYPGDAATLEVTVRGLLSGRQAEAPGAPPKAVIVPHAGYVYSGPVAAAGYYAIATLAGRVRRVALIGPAHFVAFAGIAAPSVDAFATPLGPVAVDRGAIADLAERGFIVIDDSPHRDEHSLEVQLPFLMAVLDGFALVPLVVGNAPPEAVAGVLEALWDGPGTLVVVSSDLSHYLGREEARRRDEATAAAIERLDGAGLTGEDACGYQPIAGLLLAARRRGLAARRLDLRNSGDTAGPMDRVVGYGAWAFA